MCSTTFASMMANVTSSLAKVPSAGCPFIPSGGGAKMCYASSSPAFVGCRCRVGENWWYRGEHCEEYVSEPLVVAIAIASVAGFLLVVAGIVFFLARTLRDQYDGEDTEDPLR